MIKVAIIDDEPNAIELLRGYVAKTPFLECVASFRNPLEAITYLQSNAVDLIFLDINMPELSGISFLKTVKSRPSVILTTAYSEYAVESYEHDVADYLLKPISFERFLKAATKMEAKLSHDSKPETAKKPAEKAIFVKDGYDRVRVALKDIDYLQKEGNYISYHLRSKKILSRQTVQQALADLDQGFIQIHKSYIINLDKIASFSTHTVVISGKKLPVGQSYREMLLGRMEG